MEQYFERVGDKRPDEDGIYLPTCLTEKKLYELMFEQLGTEQSISASQFNKIFKNDFKNVTIPKVSVHIILFGFIIITLCLLNWLRLPFIKLAEPPPRAGSN